MVVVVTHWDFSKKKAKYFNIPKKTEEFIDLFSKFFKFRLTEDQFIFFDNSINEDPDADPNEKRQNEI